LPSTVHILDTLATQQWASAIAYSHPSNYIISIPFVSFFLFFLLGANEDAFICQISLQNYPTRGQAQRAANW